MSEPYETEKRRAHLRRLTELDEGEPDCTVEEGYLWVKIVRLDDRIASLEAENAELRAVLAECKTKLYRLHADISFCATRTADSLRRTNLTRIAGECRAILTKIASLPAEYGLSEIAGFLGEMLEHVVIDLPSGGPDYGGHPVGERRADCPMCQAGIAKVTEKEGG